MKNGLKVAELYHGPTMAFKDLPMVCVGQMMDYFLMKQKKHATIIVCKYKLMIIHACSLPCECQFYAKHIYGYNCVTILSVNF